MITAGGIVINKSNQVLLIFRKGKWDLPKGKSENGESLKKTAKREVVEETGIDNDFLSVYSMLTKTLYYKRSRKGKLKERYANWFLMYYSNPCLSTSPQVEEGISLIKWVNICDISNYLNKGRAYMKEIFE